MQKPGRLNFWKVQENQHPNYLMIRRRLTGSERLRCAVSSHPPPGHPLYSCSWWYSRQWKRIKSSLFSTFRIHRGSHFLQLNEPVCVFAAESHSYGSLISGTFTTCSSGIKICTNHFCIIENECQVILVPKRRASHHLVLSYLHEMVTAELETSLRCSL